MTEGLMNMQRGRPEVSDVFVAATDRAGLKSDSELLRVPVLP